MHVPDIWLEYRPDSAYCGSMQDSDHVSGRGLACLEWSIVAS